MDDPQSNTKGERALPDGSRYPEPTGTANGLLVNTLKKYEILIDEVEDAISEIDLHGNILFVNKAACRIAERTKEEMIGLNFRSYFDEENQKIVYDAYTEVFQTGMPKHVSYEYVSPSGRRWIIEDSVGPLRNQDGNIAGFRVVGRDITQRRHAEDALTEHRSRLEAIFSSVKEAIITVDMAFNVIEANQAMESICGVKAREIVGKAFEACPMHCNRFCGDVLRQTLARRAPVKEYRIECGHQQHRGQLVSVTSASLQDEHGSYRGAVLVIRDISLVSNLERELRGRHQFHKLIGRSKKM